MFHLPARPDGVPSYAKLLLTLAVTALVAYFPCKVLISVRLETDRPTPQVPNETPPAAPYRLFDEYPAVAADQDAHPVETRSALWVSVRHLSGEERSVAARAWAASPSIRATVADGLYRLDCRGVTAALERVLAKYPYAVAPGERTDPILAAAYRRATAITRFRVCVVRGDWLAAALATEPEAADRLGVAASPDAAERYRDAEVSSAAVLAVLPADGRGRIAAPATVRRRSLEAADGSGPSLFVRWATAAGAGVPVY